MKIVTLAFLCNESPSTSQKGANANKSARPLCSCRCSKARQRRQPCAAGELSVRSQLSMPSRRPHPPLSASTSMGSISQNIGQFGGRSERERCAWAVFDRDGLHVPVVGCQNRRLLRTVPSTGRAQTRFPAPRSAATIRTIFAPTTPPRPSAPSGTWSPTCSDGSYPDSKAPTCSSRTANGEVRRTSAHGRKQGMPSTARRHARHWSAPQPGSYRMAHAPHGTTSSG